MKKFTYEVVIPSYNGLFLLKKHLPDVIAYSGKNTKLTVVDDGSVDGTVEYLAKNYPQVTCLHHDQNLG
ncbi:MAG: glycosyltransferase, partial [Microgenomates group bacterium]